MDGKYYIILNGGTIDQFYNEDEDRWVLSQSRATIHDKEDAEHLSSSLQLVNKYKVSLIPF